MRSKEVNYDSLSFANNLRGMHYLNDANGKLNRNIYLLISSFYDKSPEHLRKLCQIDDVILTICKLPIKELELYWRIKLEQQSLPINENDSPFEQLLNCSVQGDSAAENYGPR